MEEQVVRHQGSDAARGAGDAIPLGELERSLRRPRSLVSFLLSGMTTLLTLLALAPLFSVVFMLVKKGLEKFSFALFTSLPPAGFETDGGFGNAVVGTLVMLGIAALLSVPFGILAAVFLAEVGPQTKLAHFVRFGAKVLSGFPSILAGVFAYEVVVLYTGGFSAVAGGVALSVLMLPTVMLTAEDALKMVPAKIKEAAIGMGATQTQVICQITLPTAMPGVLTGVMLAVARAAGETAPLLFTALFSNYWIIGGHEMETLMNEPMTAGHFGREALMRPTASLAVFIYNFSSASFDAQRDMAWAAALVLVLIVLTTNLIGQSLSRSAHQE